MLAENRRIVLLGGVVIAVLLVALGGYLLFRGGPESKLTVRSIPGDLTLTLDGKQIPANGDVKVREGAHTLVGERDGFESYTQQLTAVDGKPLSVKMYLYANSAAGRAWAKDHPNDLSETEAEAGRRYDEINQRITAKYPILQELPYIGAGFKADYGPSKVDPSNPEMVAIYIKLFGPEGKQKAQEWLTGHGYDLSQLELIYTNS